MTTRQYDEQSIQILEGLDAVRKRPGMYIGSTDSRGLHHLVWEILDNSIDEAMNGFGKNITITVGKDNSIKIEDEGRGMPVGLHQSGVSTLQVIFTVLHAGGKFSSESGYKRAGGLHGVGASVVNALSEWLEVTVAFNGNLYRMVFTNGGSKISKLENLGKTNKTGSTVCFKPDEKIFGKAQFDTELINERAQESAFLLKGIKLTVKDEKANKTEVFHYDNGLYNFIEFLNEDRVVMHEPITFEGNLGEIGVQFALQYTDDYQENTYSFVNLVRTSDGGTHEIGYKSALTKVINDYARKNGVLKDKDKNFEGNDVREGCTSVLSVSIPENLLQFEGQTKSKLGTNEAKAAVDSFVSEKMSYYLEEHRELANVILKKISRASQAREAARKAREDARKGKKNGKSERLLSGKLAPCQSKDVRKTELFLVEGDSAGGSAKQGRDSKVQAILPLRGKVLNTEKASITDIEKNEELNTIIHALGAGVGSDFEIKDMNYNKVIIMTDADTDGAHIQVLLLTFFYRYMRPLIENGYVYLAQPPLYRVSKGKQFKYLYSDDELKQVMQEWGKVEIQRYKGLGEMNADQLWETTMDPSKRSLIQLNLGDALIAQRVVSVLMGDKADLRRDWIEKHVAFTLEDDFTKESNHG
ncbi:MAG TPA: DNA topoisomerase IV subunit B [Erysipelotrichaceae bacterium]|nr:DNA topoisomerase IV subunit B [Erysipelotrichaceae bacterium]